MRGSVAILGAGTQGRRLAYMVSLLILQVCHTSADIIVVVESWKAGKTDRREACCSTWSII
jgi:hypothetical protein